eukprot:TRINITY_DN1274_c3_g1_i2.p1 TRINITY_DN1274_c3_g1~~TRINITY_DN1274_c3_g1_i2.p1  ORF type:complete len:177 (-),score=39.92 TRINITY_DN1274_c3_g1_i2:374-832(-)
MYSNLTKRIQRAKQCVSSIKVELVDLEPDERAAVELQMTKHKKKISGLTQELEYAKNTSSREDLMEGRGVDATTVTVDQQIEYGKKTQDKTLALAQDARRVAKQTVEVSERLMDFPLLFLVKKGKKNKGEEFSMKLFRMQRRFARYCEFVAP